MTMRYALRIFVYYICLDVKYFPEKHFCIFRCLVALQIKKNVFLQQYFTPIVEKVTYGKKSREIVFFLSPTVRTNKVGVGNSVDTNLCLSTKCLVEPSMGIAQTFFPLWLNPNVLD